MESKKDQLIEAKSITVIARAGKRTIRELLDKGYKITAKQYEQVQEIYCTTW